MQVYDIDLAPRSLLPSSVVAIGVFDGVHQGHRVLLQQAMHLADRLGVQAVVYTFDPHPMRVLRPELGARLIEALEDRLKHLAAMGFDAAVVQHFSHTFASLSPEQFVDAYLIQALNAKQVVVGKNFTYGYRRAGNLNTLQEHLGAFERSVIAVSEVQLDDMCVSSTRIRQALHVADMRLVQQLLGRPYALKGNVQRGAQRGRLLGFPTANVTISSELTEFKKGVYVGVAHTIYGSFQAVANIGYLPTFEQLSQARLEIHLLDHQCDLYDTHVRFEMLHFLRPEQKFSSQESLILQIKQDIAQARMLLTKASS